MTLMSLKFCGYLSLKWYPSEWISFANFNGDLVVEPHVLPHIPHLRKSREAPEDEAETHRIRGGLAVVDPQNSIISMDLSLVAS